MEHSFRKGILSTLVGVGLALLPPGVAVAAEPFPSPGAAVGYSVPVAAPTGDVQVLSLGAADLPVANLIGTERFLHVRLAAVNREDDRAWILDARDQLLLLPDGTRAAARHAVASGGAADP